MTKLQYILLISATTLFFVLYFGCETKPPRQQELEKTRALEVESTDAASILRKAHAALSSGQSAAIGLLEEKLNALPEEDTSRIAILKELSGRWYEAEQPAVAGYYAESIANLQASEEAWSIAGTTFAICVQRTEVDEVREFCAKRAIKAFENAISFSPDNVAHQVNLALTYADYPPAQEPMKGILMLRSLQEKYPNSVLVLNTLASLALRTNQLDRAVQRLEQALRLEPDNINTICLLAKAYEGLGDEPKAKSFQQRCQQMNAELQ
jgi:predicted Zn-dependent protease